MNHVIIGASAAGLAGAEEIRHQDPDAHIVVISEESHPPYSRILTTHLIGGKVDTDGVRMRLAAPHKPLKLHVVRLRKQNAI